MLLLFLMPFNPIPPTDLGTIREKYQLALNSKEVANELNNLLNNKIQLSPTILGYAGAVKMLLAKYAFLPTQKYAYFKEGKLMLEKAILSEPNNLELSYLRYGIQLHAPTFLGYGENIEGDRKKLIEGVKALKDKQLKNEILAILILKGNLSTQERMQIQ